MAGRAPGASPIIGSSSIPVATTSCCSISAARGVPRRRATCAATTPGGWSPTWGGQLQFLDGRDRVTGSYIPRFNALSVFTVPAAHHVSQVTNFAPKGRVSLTGWYRMREET